MYYRFESDILQQSNFQTSAFKSIIQFSNVKIQVSSVNAPATFAWGLLQFGVGNFLSNYGVTLTDGQIITLTNAGNNALITTSGTAGYSWRYSITAW